MSQAIAQSPLERHCCAKSPRWRLTEHACEARTDHGGYPGVLMPGNPLTDPSWADETTDTLVRFVGNVRDKTTTPIVYAARGLVFGLIALFLGVFAVVILLIGLTRGMQAALDWQFTHARSVYVSYLVVGGIFSLIGLLLFKKRNANAS